MSFAYEQSEKESFLLVTFTYGDPDAPTTALYTDWQEDYVGGFISTPNMEVKLPENTGTFEEKPCTIELTRDNFSGTLGSGIAHSPCYVRVREITRSLSGGPQASDLTVFNGRVVSTVKNYQGRSDRILIRALPQKSRMEVALALPCNHHCIWTLFGRGCALSRAAFKVLGTISAIDGKQITTATAGITGKPDKYWHRGYVEYDGLRIGIQNWTLADATHLFLVRRPPDSWIGPTLDFYPGCDKTVETCIARFNNEDQFGGVGYAIPPYNPLIEDPS